MNETDFINPPAALALIEADTRAIGFSMGSDRLTGSLLRTLTASKRHAQILELGTGTGISTAWLLDGMDESSRLDTVDSDPACLEVAQRHLGDDPRITFHLTDGAEFLARMSQRRYDLIFADAWPGKYEALERALALLKPGGFYVIDDLLPQPNWPTGHAAKVPRLIDHLANRTDMVICPMSWSTGLVIAVRTE